MSDENFESFFSRLVSNQFNIDQEKIRLSLDIWKGVRINIGVIGDRGTGKSTLINAFRDLFPNDQGAAPIGIIETTKHQLVFSHPENTNILFWDLPGECFLIYMYSKILSTTSEISLKYHT